MEFKDLNYQDDDYKKIYINKKETRYCVTKDGNILSFNKTDGHVKILKHFIDRDGYHHVIIYLKGKPHYRLVSRLVAEAFIPNPENKEQVNHKDGNKDNNDVDNLEWTTPKENIIHAFNHGLSHAKSGSKHPNSVYTEKQIQMVCEMLVENKKSMRQISNETDVLYTVVKQIKNHTLWKHISEKYDFSHYNVRSKDQFDESTIKNICERLEAGDDIIAISKSLHVPRYLVYNIYNKKSWKKISKNYNIQRRNI